MAFDVPTRRTVCGYQPPSTKKSVVGGDVTNCFLEIDCTPLIISLSALLFERIPTAECLA